MSATLSGRSLPGLLVATAISVGPLAVASFGGQTRAPRVPRGFTFAIVPGEAFGPLRESTSRRALGLLVPAGEVVTSDISIGEGLCADGVRLFPGSREEVDVAWQDAAQTRVAFVRVRAEGGRWTTARGVKIGTTLVELERWAGGVLTFSGFGWDYGGGMSWPERGGTVGLRLGIASGDARPSGQQDQEIFGDRIVRSDHPAIRARRVRVVEITQSWGAHTNERDCG